MQYLRCFVDDHKAELRKCANSRGAHLLSEDQTVIPRTSTWPEEDDDGDMKRCLGNFEETMMEAEENDERNAEDESIL